MCRYIYIFQNIYHCLVGCHFFICVLSRLGCDDTMYINVLQYLNRLVSSRLVYHIVTRNMGTYSHGKTYPPSRRLCHFNFHPPNRIRKSIHHKKGMDMYGLNRLQNRRRLPQQLAQLLLVKHLRLRLRHPHLQEPVKLSSLSGFATVGYPSPKNVLGLPAELGWNRPLVPIS